MRGKSRSTKVLLMVQESQATTWDGVEICKWLDKLPTSTGDHRISEPCDLRWVIKQPRVVCWHPKMRGMHFCPVPRLEQQLSGCRRREHFFKSYSKTSWIPGMECWLPPILDYALWFLDGKIERIVWQSFLSPIFWRNVIFEIDFQSRQMWWVLLCSIWKKLSGDIFDVSFWNKLSSCRTKMMNMMRNLGCFWHNVGLIAYFSQTCFVQNNLPKHTLISTWWLYITSLCWVEMAKTKLLFWGKWTYFHLNKLS